MTPRSTASLSTAAGGAVEDDDVGQFLEDVDPEELHDSPFHQRALWGDMKGLAASLAEGGMIMPIIARWVPDPDNPKDRIREIVVGHRRKRGSIMGKLRVVPVIMRDLLDDEVIEIQAFENAKREDLHPLDECGYYLLLLERGHDYRSLAKRFNRPVEEVKDRVRLKGMCPMARDEYAKGHFSDAAAKVICQLVPDQQGALVKAIKAGAITDEGIPGWVRRFALIQLDDVPWDLANKDKPGGACTTCPTRTGGGQRTLFAGIVGDSACCANPTCHRENMEAAAVIATAAAKEAGYSIVKGSPDAVFITTGAGRPSVIRSSGFVDAEAECPNSPGKTWAQAAKAAGLEPPVIARQDQDGRVRLLIAEVDVAGTVRRAARDTGTELGRATADADPARAEQRDRDRAAKAAQATLVTAIMGDDGIAPEAVTRATLHLLTSQVVSMTTTRTVAKAVGVDVDKLVQPEADVGAHSPVRLILALAAIEAGLAAPEVRALADTLGVQIPT